VNVVGCLAIGAFMGAAQSRDWLLGPARLLVVTGFLGGFTTFSTFGLETWELVEDGLVGFAAANAAASVGVGIAAVVAGVQLTRQLV
jgi:CrcB protein